MSEEVSILLSTKNSLISLFSSTLSILLCIQQYDFPSYPKQYSSIGSLYLEQYRYLSTQKSGSILLFKEVKLYRLRAFLSQSLFLQDIVNNFWIYTSKFFFMLGMHISIQRRRIYKVSFFYLKS